MPLVPAKCPECGGNVVVDNEKDAWICDFCKTPFIVEKAINNFNTINNITNNVMNNNDIKADVVNVYEGKNSDFVIKAGKLIEYNGASMDVVIPDEVIVIAKNTFSCTNIRSIIMNDNVEDIGSYEGCKNLKYIKLSKSIKSIVDRCFKGCCNLEKIELPDSIEKIGDEAFCGCTSLKSISLPSHMSEISEGLFKRCNSIDELRIPDSVKTINNAAFYDCLNLKTIRLPLCLEHIHSNGYIGGTFQGCISLEQIDFTSQIKHINGHICEGCKSLRRVVLPDNVVEIGECAFQGCSELMYINIENVEKISQNAFDENSPIRNVVENKFTIYKGGYVREKLKKEEQNKELELAVGILDLMLSNTINKKMKSNRQCPICGKYTRNLFGICKNNNCISYMTTPSKLKDRMIQRLKNGCCPKCGSKLDYLHVTSTGYSKTLEIHCSNSNCKLSFGGNVPLDIFDLKYRDKIIK